MRTAVIIPAAGRSLRFGGERKKQFLTLGGISIWRRSVNLFLGRSEVSSILLVIPPEDRPEFEALLTEETRIRLIDGGVERFQSVANALREVPDDVELVAVHDAARPLTPHSVIESVFTAALQHGAAIAALPVADTLKRVEGDRIQEHVPRAGMWAAQTPQVFRREWLIEAYRNLDPNREGITDDSQLVQALGHEVRVVVGSSRNFKITTVEDLELAKLLVKT